MELLKNFFTGLFMIVVAAIFLGLISLLWPFLVGLGSFILTIVAAVLFLVLIFYFVVLVGYLFRRILKKNPDAESEV